MAAALGASILCASLCSRFLERAAAAKWYRGGVSLVACFIALLVGFGLTVQKDYIASWQEQKAFWTDLVALCPSLHDGDVIFVEPSGLRDSRQLLFLRKDLTGKPETRQIKSLDEVYQVLPFLYSFPSTWANPPVVLRLPRNWNPAIFAPNGELNPLSIEAGNAFKTGSRGPISASHAIFLDTQGGTLSRRSTLTRNDGTTLTLKSQDSSQEEYRPSPIFPYVVDPGGHSFTPYLEK